MLPGSEILILRCSKRKAKWRTKQTTSINNIFGLLFLLIQVLFIWWQNVILFGYEYWCVHCRLHERTVEYFHRCTIRVCQNVWSRATGLSHLKITRRKRKRRELHDAKRYRKLSVTKHFLLQPWFFHNMGVKLNIFLLVLLVATISSQGFNLRKEDDSKDEKPFGVNRRGKP